MALRGFSAKLLHRSRSGKHFHASFNTEKRLHASLLWCVSHCRVSSWVPFLVVMWGVLKKRMIEGRAENMNHTVGREEEKVMLVFSSVSISKDMCPCANIWNIEGWCVGTVRKQTDSLFIHFTTTVFEESK